MKLSFLNPKVKVDEKNRVVIYQYECKVNNCPELLNSWTMYQYLGQDALFLTTFIVKGIARCHPNDEFNVELGTKLAETRCRQKAYNIAVCKCIRAKRYFNEIIKGLDKFYSDLDYYTGVESNYEISLENAKNN